MLSFNRTLTLETQRRKRLHSEQYLPTDINAEAESGWSTIEINLPIEQEKFNLIIKQNCDQPWQCQTNTTVNPRWEVERRLWNKRQEMGAKGKGHDYSFSLQVL